MAALYAQDQLALSKHVQAIAGVRYDRFSVDFRNNRTGAELDEHGRHGVPALRHSC